MEIRQLFDNKYNKPFVPITHTKAVTDDEGNSLDTTIKNAVGKKHESTDGKNHGEIFNDYSTNTAPGAHSQVVGSNNSAIGNYSYAGGLYSRSFGRLSHAEGDNCYSETELSYAEGSYCISGKWICRVRTEIKGVVYNPGDVIEDKTIFKNEDYLETIKTNFTQSNYCHAEGDGTKATGQASHSECNRTTASGSYSHSEGNTTESSGESSHAEGSNSKASGNYSHAEGNTCFSIGEASHAEGGATKSKGTNSHSEGWHSESNGNDAHAEGSACIATGNSSHAEGNNSASNGVASHAEGGSTIATGDYSHTEGSKTQALKIRCHAEGDGTIAEGDTSHAEGYSTRSKGAFSHAEGYGSQTIGIQSHAEGDNCKAWASRSHAGGFNSQTLGNSSNSLGRFIITDFPNQTSVGLFNASTHNVNQINTSGGTGMVPSRESNNPTDTIFSVGCGNSDTSRLDGFKVLYNSRVRTMNTVSNPGADYAEMFEWLDGNPDNEDRVGYFVTLDKNKIRKANSEDSYILGIVSSAPAILGDNPDVWHSKFLKDEWGRPIYEESVIEVKTIVTNEEGVHVEVPSTEKQIIRKENPKFDRSKGYINREDRPEWDSIGLIGKLLVRQDGTLKAGEFCKSNFEGIATKSLTDSGYYVMEVISINQALVMFR